MTTYQISNADLAYVKYERFHYPDPRIQKRFQVLWLKGQRYLNIEIASIVSIHRNTVKQYLDLYKTDGIEGLKRFQYNIPVSELDRHKTSIEAYFRKYPPTSVKQARHEIKRMTGIERSLNRTRAFLKRLGMKPLKTGHIPAKADPVKQKEFVENVLQPLVNQAEKGECHLLFMDGVHFVMSAFVAIVWCFERLFIKSASGRTRINLLGAVNAKTKEIISLYNDTYIKAPTVIELLKMIRKRYRKKQIYVVLDNARYQHCKLVKKMAEELKIELVFLPSYSPNLNIIERLWKLIKSEVCAAKYYENKLDFENAILDFVEELNTNKKMKTILHSRLSCNFQLFGNAQNLAA
jgi:transposase